MGTKREGRIIKRRPCGVRRAREQTEGLLLYEECKNRELRREICERERKNRDLGRVSRELRYVLRQ